MGLSLAISLRRYLPKSFEQLTPKRALTDVFLTLLGLKVSNELGIDSSVLTMRPVRKNLIFRSKK